MTEDVDESAAGTSSRPVTRIEAFPAGARREAAATLAKSGLQLIPIGGGAAAELFGATIGARLRAQQVEWFDQVGTAINAVLEQLEGVSFDDVIDRSSFRSTFAMAVQSATKTAFEEKLDALANAVANGIGPEAPDEHYQFVFLQFIDDLQPAHLRLLAYCADPTEWYNAAGLEREHYLSAGRSAPLEKAFPEWDRSFYERLGADLTQRGLVDFGMVHGLVSENAVWSPLITELGDRFLLYTRPPTTRPSR